MDTQLKIDGAPSLASLSDYLAGEPVINVLVVTLPIWIPIIALCIVGLWRSILFRTLAPVGLGVRRALLAFGAAYTVFSFLPAGSVQRMLCLLPGGKYFFSAEEQPAASEEEETQEVSSEEKALELSTEADASAKGNWVLTNKDLTDFQRRIEGGKEEGVEWEKISTGKTSQVNTTTYRHIFPDNSTEYITVTVFEKAKPEHMFSFYCDDEWRLTWDKMFANGEILEVDAATKSEAVRWVRNYPAFCSQRDYVFGRRRWIEDGKYWTATKGCDHESRPPTEAPKRVVKYFSGWRIRQVEGRDGNMDATEVVFMHYEDFRIQQDLARFAIRQGLWGVLKNLTAGFYKYAAKIEQASLAGKPLVLPPATTSSASMRRSLSSSSLASAGDSSTCDASNVDGSLDIDERVKAQRKIGKLVVGVLCAVLVGKKVRGRRARKMQHQE